MNDDYEDFCHTDDSNPWLMVDTGNKRFNKVVVTNRQNAFYQCCEDRIGQFIIEG